MKLSSSLFRNKVAASFAVLYAFSKVRILFLFIHLFTSGLSKILNIEAGSRGKVKM